MSTETEQKTESVLDYGFNFDDFSELIVKEEKEKPEEVNQNLKSDEDETKNTETETPSDDTTEGGEEDKDKDKENTEPVEEDEPQNEWGALIKQAVDSNILTFNPDEEYAESEEGFSKLIEENIKSKQEEAINSFKESLGEEGSKILDHISKGLTVEDYISQKENYFDYDSMNIEQMSEDDKSTLVGYLLEKQGLDDESIEAQVGVLKETGKLDIMAETAKKSLKTLQDKEIAENETKLIQEQEAKNLEIERQKEDFKKSVLATRDLQGIKLSENDAKVLHDYITKPIGKNGETQYALDDNEKSRLFYAFLKMKKFDFNKLEAKAERRVGLKFKKSIDAGKTIGASKSTSTQVIENNNTNTIPNQQDVFDALSSVTGM